MQKYVDRSEEVAKRMLQQENDSTLKTRTFITNQFWWGLRGGYSSTFSGGKYHRYYLERNAESTF